MTTLTKKITKIKYGGPTNTTYDLIDGQSFSQCCGSWYTTKQKNPRGIALIPFIFGKERQADKGRIINTLKHIKSKNGDFTIMVRESW